MQAYNHASCVIQSLGEEDINVKFLVQLDKLIRLLETPVFAYLRLQVKIHVLIICSCNLSLLHMIVSCWPIVDASSNDI